MESIEIKELWSKDGSTLLSSKFEVRRVNITQYASRLRASEIHSRIKKAPFPAGHSLQAAFRIRFGVSN